MKLEDFNECPVKQKQGAPIHIQDATFYCRRLGTKEAKREVKRISNALFGPFHKYREIEDEDEKIAHVLCEYVVTGWEGVYNKGVPLPYSIENAREIFLGAEDSEGEGGFRLSINRILWMGAWDFENYLIEEAEETIDELKKP